jgi:transcriptional regulator of acetoin/glycerol metabolism
LYNRAPPGTPIESARHVRELRNTVERMAFLGCGDLITPDAVPAEIRAPASAAASALLGVRDAAERGRIVQALEQTSWNVSGAARLLGIERTISTNAFARCG